MKIASHKPVDTAPAEKTADEKNFEEQQSIRKSKIKAFKKRLKWYHILAAVLVLAIILLFVIWHLLPKKVLNVAVLDKTVLSYSEDDEIVNGLRRRFGIHMAGRVVQAHMEQRDV